MFTTTKDQFEITAPTSCRAGKRHFTENLQLKAGIDVRWITSRPHVVVTTHFDMTNVAEKSGLDNLFFDVDEMRCALSLRADLDHTILLARRPNHRLAFQHIDTNGFLHIHVRTRLDRCDRWSRCDIHGCRGSY